MDKVNIVVISGSRERLQMAAMLASVAAVTGADVTVFVSMNAVPFFLKGRDDQPQAEGAIGSLMEEKNVTSPMTLFEQAVELGDAKVHLCSMALDLLEASEDDQLPWVGEPMGLTKFLSDAESGQHWSF